MNEEMIRALLNQAAFHDVVLRAFITVMLSGREVTEDTVWAAARYTMPENVPEEALAEVRESIRATLNAARALRTGKQ